MTILKHVGFAYAYSCIATEQDFYSTGCWYVSVDDEEQEGRPDVEFASESKNAVLKFAEGLDHPWGAYSMHAPEYK